MGVMRNYLKKTQINHVDAKSIIAEIVKCGAMRTEKEVKTITQLLNEYWECFAFNLKELGCTDVLTMEIPR